MTDILNANAPTTSPYIIRAPDSTLPNAFVLYADGDGGITLNDGGPSGGLTISTNGALNKLANITASGYFARNILGDFVSRSFTSTDNSIVITNGSGVTGSSDFSVAPGTTVQNIILQQGGVSVGEATTLNFANSTDITASVSSVSNSVSTITISLNTPSAPASASFVTLKNEGFTNGKSLGSLGNGLLKNTTSSSVGALSIAVSGTDYLVPNTKLNSISAATAAKGELLVGDGTQFVSLALGAADTILISNGTAANWVSPSNAKGIVTSVGLTVSGAGASVTGSPVTSSGIFALTIPNWSTQAATSQVKLASNSLVGAQYIAVNNTTSKNYAPIEVSNYTSGSTLLTGIFLANLPTGSVVKPTAPGGTISFDPVSNLTVTNANKTYSVVTMPQTTATAYAPSVGSILYAPTPVAAGGASNLASHANLPIGTTGQVLTVSSGLLPTWTTVSGNSLVAARSIPVTSGTTGQIVNVTGITTNSIIHVTVVDSGTGGGVAFISSIGTNTFTVTTTVDTCTVNYLVFNAF